MAEFVAILGAVFFLLLLFGGMWVPYAIGIAGTLMLLVQDGPASLTALGYVVWGSMDSGTLSAIPLFVLMAAVLLRSGVSGAFYDGLSAIVRPLPGGLLQTNIAGCALFSAISGSSITTAAALGMVAIPKLREQGYNSSMATGSLAAGGTLGILIPPSIAMIIYGSFTELSISRLFAAGLLPGLLLAALFMTYVGLRCLLQPSLVPAITTVWSLRAAARGTVRILPLVLLMATVLGSIYLGIATPTEAAAVGSAFALAIGLVFGDLSMAKIAEAAVDTVKMSAAILFIVFAAFIFAYAVQITGIAQSLTAWLIGLELSRAALLFGIVVMYVLLGCLIDSVGMIVLTVPLLTPALSAMGFDLYWFGVLLVILVELGQITPPFGINLFIIEGISGRGMAEVVRGVVPYHLIILAFVLIIIQFPGLAIWLPSQIHP
jgi:tripartite ATP-independent transporter DctM subunit